MIGIEELSTRVTQAEQRFGLISAEHAKYSARLVSLLNTVENRLHEQETAAERQAEINARLQNERDQAHGENEQLRDMLLSLLKAVENGGRDQVMLTMQTLEARVSALVIDGAAEEDVAVPVEAATAEDEAAQAAVETAAEETAADDAAEDEPPAPDDEVQDLAVDSVEQEADVDLTAAQEAVSDDAAEPADGSVSLADIMQRVSVLANADDDPPSGESDDSAAAEVDDPSAAATGT